MASLKLLQLLAKSSAFDTSWSVRCLHPHLNAEGPSAGFTFLLDTVGGTIECSGGSRSVVHVKIQPQAVGMMEFGLTVSKKGKYLFIGFYYRGFLLYFLSNGVTLKLIIPKRNMGVAIDDLYMKILIRIKARGPALQPDNKHCRTKKSVNPLNKRFPLRATRLSCSASFSKHPSLL